MTIRWAIVGALCGALVSVSPAAAWGAKGHRMIGVLAAQNFAAGLPGFLKTPDAIFQLGELAREPDRSRDAGPPHDDDRDPAHFLNLLDDGTVAGGPRLDALPASRRDYDTALRAQGTEQYKQGWLPYAISDGYEQLVKDFVVWRADAAGLSFATSKTEQGWFRRDKALREQLIIRDLGVWSHFVGDASQPMHVSVHYDGWSEAPNPEGFTSQKGFHSRFETAFVDAHVEDADVAALLPAPQSPSGTIQNQVSVYLADTASHVPEAYRLDKAGAFDRATLEARHFTALRLAQAAGVLRDWVVEAWAASAQGQLGYKPAVPLSDIEAGKANPYPLLQH